MTCEFTNSFAAGSRYVIDVAEDYQRCDSSWIIQENEKPNVVRYLGLIHWALGNLNEILDM